MISDTTDQGPRSAQIIDRNSRPVGLPAPREIADVRFSTDNGVRILAVHPFLFEPAALGDTITYQGYSANYAGNGRWLVGAPSGALLISADWGLFRFPAIGCLGRMVDDEKFPLSSLGRFPGKMETGGVSRAPSETLSDKT